MLKKYVTISYALILYKKENIFYRKSVRKIRTRERKRDIFTDIYIYIYIHFSIPFFAVHFSFHQIDQIRSTLSRTHYTHISFAAGSFHSHPVEDTATYA